MSKPPYRSKYSAVSKSNVTVRLLAVRTKVRWNCLPTRDFVAKAHERVLLGAELLSSSSSRSAPRERDAMGYDSDVASRGSSRLGSADEFEDMLTNHLDTRDRYGRGCRHSSGACSHGLL